MGRFTLAVCLAASLCGCGNAGNPALADSGSPRPKAGDTCGTYGAQWPAGVVCDEPFLFQGEKIGPFSALDCQRGVFEKVPCSPGYCETTTSGKVICENKNPAEGVRCFAANEGTGTCSADAGVRFQCLDAGFVGTRCPDGCAVAGGSVTCS